MKTNNLLFCLYIFFLASMYSCGNNQSNSYSQREERTQEIGGHHIDTLASSESTKLYKKIDKGNLVIKEWNTNVISNIRVLDHVTTYNAQGQKVEEIEYNTEGQKWRERYEYDSNGKKIRELIYDGHNVLYLCKKNEYNEFGKKKVTYTYNAKGKLIAIKNFEYITQ